ncbi:deaminase [Streptomyces sp. NPDC048362]|uniref:deaminase n=1 Tax=Streptomyces sp. NPDC048362 TaxID=3365539 RepID=UPI003718811B
MRIAVRHALRSQCKFKVGAVIVSGSRVMGASPNIQRNSSLIDYKNATFHAEEAAIRRAPKTMGASIFVARIGAQGKTLLAKPCVDCQSVLASFGIKVAYYTTGNGSVGVMKLPRVSNSNNRRPVRQIS